MKAQVKEWMAIKLAQELSLPRIFHLEIFCGIKETDRAVYAMFYTGYKAGGRKANHRCHWIPKSAIENLESLKKIEDYDEAIKAFDHEYDM